MHVAIARLLGELPNGCWVAVCGNLSWLISDCGLGWFETLDYTAVQVPRCGCGVGYTN